MAKLHVKAPDQMSQREFDVVESEPAQCPVSLTGFLQLGLSE